MNKYTKYNQSKKGKKRTKNYQDKKYLNRQCCNVCGEIFKGKAIASPVTMIALVHQKCDPGLWMRVKRKLKKDLGRS